MDIFFFNLINHIPHYSFTDGFVVFLEWIGEKEAVYSIIAIFFTAGLIKKRKGIWLVALGAFSAEAMTGAVVFLVKHIVERPRPFILLSDVYRIGHATSPSFPSGHAAVYAAGAGFLMLWFKKFQPFWMIVLFLGGFGRIYQGMHYPSDVLAGWLIGLFFAWLTVSVLPAIDSKIRIPSLNNE